MTLKCRYIHLFYFIVYELFVTKPQRKNKSSNVMHLFGSDTRLYISTIYFCFYRRFCMAEVMRVIR